MTENRIQKFANDFYQQFGLNLEQQIPGNQPNKLIAFANRIERIVYEEIKEKCPTFRHTRLSAMQRDAIWRVCLEQAYYQLTNYDMNVFVGIDPVSGSTIPLDEIRGRAFSPLARKMLVNAGLFYAGIYLRSADDKPFTSFWED